MSAVRNVCRLLLDYLTVAALYAHGATAYGYAKLRDRRKS